MANDLFEFLVMGVKKVEKFISLPKSATIFQTRAKEVGQRLKT